MITGKPHYDEDDALNVLKHLLDSDEEETGQELVPVEFANLQLETISKLLQDINEQYNTCIQMSETLLELQKSVDGIPGGQEMINVTQSHLITKEKSVLECLAGLVETIAEMKTFNSNLSQQE
jgi:hypothetical protein